MVIDYFFSAIDTDFKAQSSRDPLGLQTIWTASARRLIPYLSTVSTDIIDFKILCLARYLWSEKEPNNEQGFGGFLTKFEQACAFARYHATGAEGVSFNGISNVKTRYENVQKEGAITVSSERQECMILSNQRSYGIYGKYHRPFTDVGIGKDPDFTSIMSAICKYTDNFDALAVLLNKLLSPKSPTFSIPFGELELLIPLLQLPQGQEKLFFTRCILQTPESTGSINNCQNILYDILRQEPTLATRDNLTLYPLLALLRERAEDASFKGVLDDIEQTEKIIYPLHSMFSFFLSRPRWTHEQLDDNESEFFTKGFSPVDTERLIGTDDNGIRCDLNKLLEPALAPSQRIAKLVERNAQVSKKRGKTPWVIAEDDIFTVLSKGATPPQIIAQNDNCNFYYFLPGYLNLFRQIHLTA